MEIVFEKPERMNLLGYLLRSRLRHRLTDESFCRRLEKILRPLLIEAGGMRVFLLARDGKLHISAEPYDHKACAGIRAELLAVLELMLYRRWLLSFLAGKIAVWGRVWKLLPLLGLLPPRSKR
jgi:hypothetical protein